VLLAACLILAALIAAAARRQPTAPRTALHYAPNANFAPDGTFRPGAVGFNLADVSSPAQLALLPPGVKALVWVGRCGGVDAHFLRAVGPYVGRPRIFGFYLMDDPDLRLRLTPDGLRRACTIGHLNAETDWIHAHMPHVRTFIVLMNLASPERPSYGGNEGLNELRVDLVGVDPYPCRSERHRCFYPMIDRYVAAAKSAGIPADHIVPVYQTFGGGRWMDGSGGRYVLPSRRQERRILARWGALAAQPAFDYAYSWGSQRQDCALANSPGLRMVFARHNREGATARAAVPAVGPARLPPAAGSAPQC
jgi:hypothetical protein